MVPMIKPKLLDLFCCEGGAAMGYHRAGFDVIGVDIERGRGDRYPFQFFAGDALDFLAQHVEKFDAIHASPPCQMHSSTRHWHDKEYEDFLTPTREALKELAPGKPWVIENVVGAPLVWPITLCGAAFDLTAIDTDGTKLVLKRHRLFESNIFLRAPACGCKRYATAGYKVGGIYGKGTLARRPSLTGGGYIPSQAVVEQLAGIDWMSSRGLAQSIPPAYTEFIGEQLLEAIA